MKKQINMSNTEYHHIPKLVRFPWRKSVWQDQQQVFQKCSPDGNVRKKMRMSVGFFPHYQSGLRSESKNEIDLVKSFIRFLILLALVTS